MMCSNVLARNFDPSSSSSSHPLDTYIGNLFSQLKWIMYIEYRYQSGGPRTHFSIILKENYNQCSALRLVDLKWNSSDLDIILKQYEYLFLEILSTINFTPKSLDIRQDNCILSYYSIQFNDWEYWIESDPRMVKAFGWILIIVQNPKSKSLFGVVK